MKFSYFHAMEDKFRLDRTAFKTTSAKEADDHVTEWRDQTPRALNAACQKRFQTI